MRFYARPSWRLFWQVAADLFVLVWAIAWWSAGRFTDQVIRSVAEPARQVARLGADAQRQVADAAAQAAGVPVVGDGLRRPFDELSVTMRGLVTSANEQVTSIEQAATFAGWLVFLIPVLTIVALWLPRRLAFAARARETLALAGTSDGVALLALRALATQPLAELRQVAPDPVAAWRAGDVTVTGRLADLELTRAGVRPHPRQRSTLAR